MIINLRQYSILLKFLVFARFASISAFHLPLHAKESGLSSLKSKMSTSAGEVAVKPRCLIIPGCGCSPVSSSNWYAYMKMKLIESGAFSEVLSEDMPDPVDAKEKIWIPFIVNKLKIDENTVIIGHSSGAEAAMRLLENHKLLGMVLVCACHTDLGSESERAAGYYNRTWEWEKIKSNANWILQYHSSDDPFIPIAEANLVAEKLSSEYFKFEDKSHFFAPKDIERANIVGEILKKING